MELIKKFFPEIMQDNELVYFQHFKGMIDSVDELAIVEVTKTPTAYIFRVSASTPQYVPLLLEEILKFHNIFQIRLDISKSIKTTGTLQFEIKI
jgi:hypothetical protein